MTTKKMLKQLVANGYVEEGTKLPDKEIRSLYEEMLADEAKIASAKTESEVVPIPEKERLVELACRYDRTTDFIDNYHQQLQAEEKNEKIQAEFIEICTKLGYLVSTNDFIKVVSKTGTVHSTMSVEEAVDAMLLLAEKQETKTVAEQKEENVMTNKYLKAYTTAKSDTDKAQVLYELLDNVDNITNVHAENYIKKDALLKFCKRLGLGCNNRMSRPELFMVIKNHAAELVKAEEIVSENTQVVTESTVVTIDTVWNVTTANAVVHKMMSMAKSNRYINFISDFILESLITEVLFGKSKKYKDGTGKYVDNSFTDEQLALLVKYKEKFVEKYLIPNGKDTGFTIKSFLMAWYYKKVKYRFNRNGVIVDYVIDYKNGVATRLDNGTEQKTNDELFVKIDTSCTFVNVM